MVLQVAQVPNPPAGVDWTVAVPGHQLWDITGITAKLTTGQTLPAVHDSSGRANNGTYDAGMALADFGVAGLVAGDTAVDYAHVGGPGMAAVPMSGNWWDSGPSWWNIWVQPARHDIVLPLIRTNPFISGNGPFATLQWQAGTLYTIGFQWGVTVGQDAVFVSNINIGAGAHMFSWKMDLAGALVTFYLDGAVVGAPQAFTVPPTGNPTDAVIGFALAGPETYDEVAWGAGAPADATFANLFAQASVSYAAYSAAVLAMGTSCEAYYKLDDVVPGLGRTPSLFVSDGTHTVLELDPGFVASPTGGPYNYSWVPNGGSVTRSADGKLTTVGVPPLVLPAGYVLGTVTPDIGPADQWSDIAVWWSTDVMDVLADFNPYAYPPGAFLQYRQIGT